MKKLIAISVMLALVAGAAFAETSVGGALELHWGVASGSSAGGDPVTTAGLGESQITFSTSDDEGKAGGMLRYKLAALQKLGPQNNSWEPDPADPLDVNDNFNTARDGIHNRAFIWWKPIEQVELFLGKDGDGKFNTAGLSRWGFHRGTRGVADEGWDADRYLLGNWDNFGFALMVNFQGAFVNFAMNLPNPLGDGGSSTWEAIFKNSIMLQAGYGADFGKITFTFRDMGDWWAGADGLVGLTFESGGLVDGLAFEVGGSYDITANRRNAIRILAGAHYTGGDWGARARFYVQGFDTFFFKCDIMPWYNFGFMAAYLNISLNHTEGQDLSWGINPYVVKDVGPVQMRMGLKFNGQGSTTTWAIPIGAVVSF